MIEHHIQKDILLRLSKAPYLRFSELKPSDLESNIFMYHLKQLRAQKLVEKTDAGYQLSDMGLAYIDGFSFHMLKPRKQPKLISILVIKDSEGRWLLAKRKYQPYFGQYMFASGKQHLGEDPLAHAERELKEKMGLSMTLKRRGMSDIRIYRGNNLISHVAAHIYEGYTNSAILPAETDQFEFVWVPADGGGAKLLAGTREIMDRLNQSDELFFMSLDAIDD